MNIKRLFLLNKFRCLIQRFFFSFRYLLDFYSFSVRQKEIGERFSIYWKDRYPRLLEKTSTTHFDAHYIYHPAWAARIIAETKPEVHIDLSSTLHFCTLISAFVPVEFYDFRPADLNLSGLSSNFQNLTNLSFPDESIHSLSCMHVVEHIGLGRYGDPIDPNGDLSAINELKRILARRGNLLFVVPVGRPRIMFNAHRVYSYDQIASYFSDLQIEQFALIDDDRNFIIDADPALANQQSYGCGCWWFKKI